MAKNNVADWSTTNASNSDIAGTDITGTTGLVKNGDNAIRELMVQDKKWWNDLGAQVTVGGTANAITITSSSTYQSLASGIRILFKPSADNSGATTLNLDSLGAKAVRKISGGTDVALTGGELKNAQRAELVYDSTANSAAGAWILLNPDGGTTYLALAGGTMTGQVNFAPTVTIASAATVNIGAAAANELIISGTTTITAFDTVAAGITREVLFSGALTLTHNGTSLNLPGSANITTAANDTAAFRSLGSGNWVCLWYKKADGTPITATGLTLLGTLTTTSGTTQSLTNIPSGYRALFCEIDGVSFTAAVFLTLATSSTNGAAYGTAAQIAGSLTAASNAYGGAIWIYNIASTGQTQVASSTVNLGSTDKSFQSAGVATNTAAVVNAIQFAGGTFDAGTIRVYGVK